MRTKRIDNAELRGRVRHSRQILRVCKRKIRIHPVGKPPASAPVQEAVHHVRVGLKGRRVRNSCRIENRAGRSVDHPSACRKSCEVSLCPKVFRAGVHEKVLLEVARRAGLVGSLRNSQRGVRRVLRNRVSQQVIPGPAARFVFRRRIRLCCDRLGVRSRQEE